MTKILKVTIDRKSSQLSSHKFRTVALKTDKPLPERHVNMSNALTRAAHGLTLAEKRVITCGLANTDSRSAHAHNQAMMHGGWLIRLVGAGLRPSDGH